MRELHDAARAHSSTWKDASKLPEQTLDVTNDVTTRYDLDGLRQTHRDGILQFSDLRGARQSRLDASNQLGKLMFCH